MLLVGYMLAFSYGFEPELKEHLLNMSGCFDGLSAKNVRRLAFDLAEQMDNNALSTRIARKSKELTNKSVSFNLCLTSC